jgi:RimJ/RimL family protein N-acetyltransferase
VAGKEATMHRSARARDFDVAGYSHAEFLRNGKPLEIRALTPGDRAGLKAAVDRTSGQTLYRRFFSPRGTLTEAELEYFSNVDFIDHVALVATAQEGGRPVIVGGARFIVVKPGRAELAIAVIDAYQGQGIGLALVKSLVQIAQRIGIRELIADVLAENVGMLKVFDKCGFPLAKERDGGVIHIAIDLPDRVAGSVHS